MNVSINVVCADLKYAGLRYCVRRDRFVVFVKTGSLRPCDVGVYTCAREAERCMKSFNSQFASEEV